MIKWFRTSRLSIKNSLSVSQLGVLRAQVQATLPPVEDFMGLVETSSASAPPAVTAGRDTGQTSTGLTSHGRDSGELEALLEDKSKA